MKLQQIIRILEERMSGADMGLILLYGSLAVIALVFLLWRYGAGFLMALTFMMVGLQVTQSNTFNGIILIARFPVVTSLAIYALLCVKNRRPLTGVCFIFGLLPVVMFINSFRSYHLDDAIIQSVLFGLLFIGLIIGGRKVFGDERGRKVLVVTLMLYSILMACVQIPFWGHLSELGRLEGFFEDTVGVMTVGMVGAIVLAWFGIQQHIWSPKFLIFMAFSGLNLIIVILSGGRTATAGALMGIVIVLSQQMKRNVIVFLMFLIIGAPIGLHVIRSFTGFESVKTKFSQSSSSGRAELYGLAWDEIQQSPILGYGTGSSSAISYTRSGMSYHNSYLEYAVDYGLPFALVIFLLFMWLPVRGLLLMRRCQTFEMRVMANLSAALLVAYSFSGFLGSVLGVTTGIIPVYLAVGLQEGVYAQCRELDRDSLLLAGEEYLQNDTSDVSYDYEEGGY